MRVLLVNPPIYDFTAYDFWLKPYGMLRVAGRLEHDCEIVFFDYLVSRPRDSWGRGRFPEQLAVKPDIFQDIARRYRRFGRPRAEFVAVLKKEQFDVALIQTGMTYWYPGVSEVIEDLREHAPGAKIVLGGIYATLCPDHARSLGADLVIEGENLEHLRRLLPIGDRALPFRNADMGVVAAMKLTDGCPFSCTYCCVPLTKLGFSARMPSECLDEVRFLVRYGAQHVAFYDDALLFRPEETLVPFLERVIRERLPVAFHTPNAVHVRLLTPDVARLMVRAGFRSFFLGFESQSSAWLTQTGEKLSAEEFDAAVAMLREAHAESITAYLIIGHPNADEQEVEASMHAAHRSGARILLSEFSPIPGTPDGERCRAWADLEEPLTHNKTAFTIRRLGAEKANQLKTLARTLNQP